MCMSPVIRVAASASTGIPWTFVTRGNILPKCLISRSMMATLCSSSSTFLMSSKPPIISSIWGQTVGTLAGALWPWARQRAWRRSRSRIRAISCVRCYMPALPAAARRLKLLLEYSGTRYHGWQEQPNAVTVQATLEACLSRLTNGPVRLHAAGSTDAGVHALGQVVHFDTASTIALAALVRGANSLLPRDIVVRQAEDVPMD